VNLQARVVNILTKPKTEWPVIAAEPRDVATLYRNYIVLLAAVPPLCMAIGQSIIGISVPFFGHYRVPIASAIVSAVVSYVFSLVGVYIGAFVIAKLAPTFQSDPDVGQALKIVAYASTPSWVAGILYIIPALSPLVLLAALYGIYICYLGMTPTMKTPPEKVIVYMVVAAVVMIVVFVVVGLVAAGLSAAIGFSTVPALQLH
jgi:hypothetical protein